MKIYGFTEKDVDRLRRSVRHFEGYYRNGAPGRPRYPVGGGGGLVHATANAAVAAGSMASPTSFTATLTILSGAGPGRVNGTQTVTAKNTFNATIGSGKQCWLQYIDGFWYVVQADC